MKCEGAQVQPYLLKDCFRGEVSPVYGAFRSEADGRFPLRLRMRKETRTVHGAAGKEDAQVVSGYDHCAWKNMRRLPGRTSVRGWGFILAVDFSGISEGSAGFFMEGKGLVDLEAGNPIPAGYQEKERMARESGLPTI